MLSWRKPAGRKHPHKGSSKTVPIHLHSLYWRRESRNVRSQLSVKAITFDSGAAGKLEWTSDANYQLERVFVSTGGSIVLSLDSEADLSSTGTNTVRFDYLLCLNAAVIGEMYDLAWLIVKGVTVFVDFNSWGDVTLFLAETQLT